MEYFVYTDGSSDRGTVKAGWGYSITTKTNFIGYSYGGIETVFTLEAEVAGAVSALDAIGTSTELQSGDIITMHVDSLLLLTFIDGYIKTKDKLIPFEAKNKNSLMFAIDNIIRKGVTLRTKKVKAHKGVITPNTFVDQLARYGRARITRW